MAFWKFIFKPGKLAPHGEIPGRKMMLVLARRAA
jgi:hypothetical protein